MSCCQKCNTWFRDSYNLKKHMSRVKPCDFKNVKNNNKENELPTLEHQFSTLLHQSSTLLHQSSTQLHQSSTPVINNLKCKFCFNTFSNNSNLKRHEKICKECDDPVRLLEIEKDIKPKEPLTKTECRFCNCDFSRIDSLKRHFKNCKEREEYHQELLKRKENNQTIINNNTTNNFNAPVNNITINLLGNESTNHIDIHKIISKLRTLRNNYEDNHIYLQAGEMVISYDDQLREVPENQNIFIPNEKSLYAEVKTEVGWEKKEREQSLNESFKNSAKLLYDAKESIQSVNEKVFKFKSNQKVFKEVGKFAKN